MKTNKWHFVYFVFFIALAVGIGIFLSRDKQAEVIYRTTTDTIFDTVYHHALDTIEVGFPVLVDDGVIDTLYLTKTEVLKDTDSIYVKLPIEQKHYAQDSLYDVWISGVEPNLDSLNVYQKTEYVTITNEIKTETIKEIYPQRTEWYVFGGLSVSDGTLSPKVGVSLKTKKDWLISPEIGWHKNNPTYGITIGKKFK